MIIHSNLEQGTLEWFAIRKGKVTASHATAIGNNGKGLDTYIMELMAEYFSSGEKETYTNSSMERGNELEEQARSLYELKTGNKVEEVGFCEYNEFVGCSPDGLVNDDGGVEIKCPDDKGYFNVILNGAEEIASGYNWQMQMCMFVTGRKWWDFICYNPNYEKSMFIHRVLPDPKLFEKLAEGFKKAEIKIEEIKAKYKAV